MSLIKVLRRSRANPEELRTVLCESRRELTIALDDRGDRADDDMALTPAYFFIGRELSSLPNTDRHCQPVSGDSRSLALLHRRWRHQKKMVDHLRSRCKQEYLVTLSARGKGASTTA
ncbi:hypothetical protein T07_13279 [Trichinella nelsoni]|uniref:Uncharacterized protein n=1 Tax=Trichinella nelsoni TaxID=6336 RepID=A0A0V0RHR2_9BILA|nr:hypothetical protein T07_13279 [Trichinella nelsoni]